MQMFKVEVDEVVWAFLKKNAKDASETPNTVLRRVLSLQDTKVDPNAAAPKYGEDWSCS